MGSVVLVAVLASESLVGLETSPESGVMVPICIVVTLVAFTVM